MLHGTLHVDLRFITVQHLLPTHQYSSMGKPHEQLDAWKFSMELAKAVYQMTATFPAEERYGLSQQMRRAAVSIPSNIAEGAGRNGPKEYLHFIGISRG